MFDEDALDEQDGGKEYHAGEDNLLEAPTDPLGRKPRIACLHGGAGNEHIFRTQLKRLIDTFGDDIELCFIEGCLLSEEVRTDPRGQRNIELMRSFFGKDQVLREHAVTTYGPRGEKGPFFYKRLDEGIAHCEQQLADLAPVDALLGFSQGANFSTILSARAARGLEGAAPPFRCVVLLENDRPGWPEQKPELFDTPLPVPALVVSGETDSEAGDAIAKMFTAVVASRHSDGHRPLPKDPEAIATLVTVAREFILEHCPK